MNESEVARLMVRLMGDSSSYDRMLNRATIATNRFTQMLGFSLSNISLTGLAVKFASMFETLETQFGTFLGSDNLGRRMTSELRDLAATTPLTFTGVTQGARTLLQYGVQARNIIPTLRQIGDVTGNDQQVFMRMAIAFGQVAQTGHLMGQELRQMINAGFNPLQEISRTTGRSIDELRGAMRHGGITMDMVSEAFRTATSEGGRFNDSMLRQSRTLYGLWTNLKDDTVRTLATIGKEIVDALDLRGVVRSLSEMVNRFTAWFGTLGVRGRKAIAILVSIGAAITAMATSISVLQYILLPVFNAIGMMLGFVGFLLSPIGILIAGIVAVAAAGIEAAGGWQAAWESVRAWFADFWQYIVPIWNAFLAAVRAGARAFQRIAVAIWTAIRPAVMWLWSFVSNMFAGWFREGSSFGENFLLTLIAIEFGFNNLGRVADLMWLGFRIGLGTLVAEAGHFFTTTMPALLLFMARNFGVIFNDIVRMFMSLWENYIVIARESVGVVLRLLTFQDLDPIGGFRRAVRAAVQEIRNFRFDTPAFEAPVRIPGAAERELRRQYAQLAQDIAEDWITFRDRRWAELMVDFGDDPVAAALQFEDYTDDGVNIGQELASGIRQGMRDWDHAIFGSAEANRRIQDYRERLLGLETDPRLTGGGRGRGAASLNPTSSIPGLPSVSAVPAVPRPPVAEAVGIPVWVVEAPAAAGAMQQQNVVPTDPRILEFLRRIAVATEFTATHDQLELAAVGL